MTDGCHRPTVAGLRGVHVAQRLAESIAETADGLDEVVAAERLEQLAQAAHMNVHGPMPCLDVFRPRATQQLVAAENASLVLEKESHQPKLRRSEIDGTFVHQ